jgi:hypothetical protein
LRIFQINNRKQLAIINKNMEETGLTATLVTPYKGYSNIELLRRMGDKWLVRICGSGRELEVYEDEFILD